MHGVPNKALQFANCESFLENCKSKLPFFWEIANQLFLMMFFFSFRIVLLALPITVMCLQIIYFKKENY